MTALWTAATAACLLGRNSQEETVGPVLNLLYAMSVKKVCVCACVCEREVSVYVCVNVCVHDCIADIWATASYLPGR